MFDWDIGFILADSDTPANWNANVVGNKKVISAAGPLRLEADVAKPLRDEVTALLITETVNQTHYHISNVAGTGLASGGFGTLVSQAAPTDTDRDGMPDFREKALGWNAATDDHTTLMANDGTTCFPAATAKGYTRLEVYLHWLGIPHATVQRNTATDPTAIDIDLRKFTSGFTVTPVFTLTGFVGGAATQSGAGGHLVHFVPTVNIYGRARFEFKVQDAAGSQSSDE